MRVSPMTWCRRSRVLPQRWTAGGSWQQLKQALRLVVVRFIPALVVNSDEIGEAAGRWSDAVAAVTS
jgi:hypothetical protein